MSTRVISTEKEFEALMEEIDEHLRRNNVPVHAREIRAIMETGTRLKAPVPLAPIPEAAVPGDYTGGSLAAHVSAWVRRRYGDRLKVDFSIGRSILVVRRDPWLARFPLLYGQVELVCDPDLTRKYVTRSFTKIKGELPKLNVLTQIENFPLGLAKQLSPSELQAIMDRFVYCQSFFMTIHNKCRDDDLAHGAIADLKASAQHLVESREFGLSRWASLQGAEKLLKHFIRAKGKQFPRTHDLTRLADIAAPLGLTLVADLAQVQCEADVRYQSGNHHIDDVTAAHVIAVDLGVQIMGTLYPSTP